MLPDPLPALVAVVLLPFIGWLLGVHWERDRQERAQEFAARRRQR